MKEVKLETTITVYENLEELPDDAKDLMDKAIEARQKSYSPYSKFAVGAALQLENGRIVTGSNQENASYPSGLCAERTAIFYAGAKYPGERIMSLAITAASSQETTKDPIPPCGACRQVIAEYEVKQETPIEIYFMGEIGRIAKSDSLANLLPFVFKASML
jgi:cytidine deaminase